MTKTKLKIGDRVRLLTEQTVYGSRYFDNSPRMNGAPRTYPPGTIGTVAQVDVPCVTHRKGNPWTFNCVDMEWKGMKLRCGVYTKELVKI